MNGDYEPHEMGRTDAALAGFEHGPVLTVVAEGPDLRISAINAADRAFVGREVLGQPLPEVCGPQVAQAARDVLATGHPAGGREWRFDEAPRAGRYVDFYVSPWHGPEGQIRGVVAQGIALSAQETPPVPAGGPPELSERMSQLVAAMQDALLPTDLPVLPGLEVAARYLLQEDLARSGGDWFDAVPLPHGSVALVVGDVVGSGVTASAIMGQLRAVLHERLAGGACASEALVVLDRFARGMPEAHAATVCIAHLDVDSGRLVYCTAGHPPPLVLEPDGETRFLESTGGRPLGVSHRPADTASFPVREMTLAQDATVLLYSDGAVERPGRTPAENTVELARVVGSVRETSLDARSMAELEVARVCARTLDVLAWLTGYDDDITLLAAQRVPRVAPLDVTVPAVPASADRLRTELGRWLDSLALTELDRTVLVHAANELGTNAIDHAYPSDEHGQVPADAVVEMRADLLPTGVVEVVVCDHGTWREPDRREHLRGRGLALTAGLVDELDIVPATAGTPGTVTKVRHKVRREAALLTPATPRSRSTPVPEVPFSLSVDDEQHRLDVAGPVDEQASDRLLAVLRTMSRGGSATVTVDLSAVTQLPSVAVRSLYEVHYQMQRPAELVLHAAMGSPAQHVLDIVGLPYS